MTEQEITRMFDQAVEEYIKISKSKEDLGGPRTEAMNDMFDAWECDDITDAQIVNWYINNIDKHKSDMYYFIREHVLPDIANEVESIAKDRMSHDEGSQFGFAKCAEDAWERREGNATYGIAKWYELGEGIKYVCSYSVTFGKDTASGRVEGKTFEDVFMKSKKFVAALNFANS